jgi:hypothetical protein
MTAPSPSTLTAPVDEFDIDLQVLNVETTAWFGDDPKWTDDGSTCRFSCQQTCGGTCTCPGDCFGD